MGIINKNKLSLIYDKREKDFIVKYPKKCDGNLVLNHILGDILRFDFTKFSQSKKFGQSKEMPYEIENFKEELEKRGYDLSTLKFSIELKKENENE